MGKEIVTVLEDDAIVESTNDNVITLEKDVIRGDGATEPQPGMKFKDENELFDFYKRYAYEKGFPMRKRNSKKGDDGVVNYVTLTCSRDGKRSYSTNSTLKPQPTIQTGRKARLTAASDIHGTWRICIVHLDHNHKTSPSKSRLYRCNRELSAQVKRKLEVNNVAGIPLHKSCNSAVVEAGGYENITYVEKDYRNYVEKCMHGKAPNGIITDQDRAMQNAIQIVFPNTKHRWCLWYILKKLPEKFGYHAEKGSIFASIHRLVYDSQSTEEFERGWTMTTDTHNLNNNEWLSSLYENRGRWVPCYLNTTFSAGMSTTQRSESMNTFFDGYMNSKTSLKQFVEQYERALRNKVEKEFQADFKFYSQMVPCAMKYVMEKQFQILYTISKFKEF
ncbi:protein FAR1-RELATED SEQUENCE 1-like [Olea europaea var. sylvestris]|uniref:protein FAR1-RELATED SEQUENCE 1-like n=1 Tax=Olea europaea var. sylvestris TaxID=158386 RepID=UPI000C1CFC9B|nr:protein FAR1-RELATED SEQUENCE 1-like [Olea europaea var. sylvestris]